MPICHGKKREKWDKIFQAWFFDPGKASKKKNALNILNKYTQYINIYTLKHNSRRLTEVVIKDWIHSKV